MQQWNILPSSIKQALLNKLLAGSSAQLIWNPNTQNYDVYSYNALNNPIPGNFYTNNVLVPTEHLPDRTNDINDNIPKDSKGKKHSKRAKKKKRKSKINQNSAKPNENDAQKHSVKETNKNHKKNKRNKSIQDFEKIRVLENEESKNKTTRKSKRIEQITENPIDKNIEKSVKLRRRKKKSKKNKMKKNESENLLTDFTSRYDENIDLDITQDGKNNENRKTRNSKHEVNNIIKSYPNTPQDITNNFLTNLNQLNNPLLSNWFAHYENLYQSLSNKPTIVTESTPKRKRKHKRKKNKKKKNAQNRNSTAITKSGSSNTSENNFIATDLYSDPIVESFKSFETSDRNMKYTSNEIFQDGYSINEFEDKYGPGYYESYIDDYYPQFTDSAAYTANNKEIILKNLNDQKYYYVSDSIETTTPKIKQEHQKSSINISENAPNDFGMMKRTYEEVEKETIRNAYKENFEKHFEEEIRFQSPPFLESPDFETRKIDKSEIQATQVTDDHVSRYVGDKSFTAKTANLNGAKKNGIQPQTKDIETVYANSKVVAYGPVYIPEEDASSADSWENHFTSNIYQNGDTTYVLAQSIDDDEQ